MGPSVKGHQVIAVTASPGAARMDRIPILPLSWSNSCLGSWWWWDLQLLCNSCNWWRTWCSWVGEEAKTWEYKTSFYDLTSNLKAEEPRSIYTRLSAGLSHQSTYATTHLGIYTVLFQHLTGADGTPPSFLLKVLIGMTAGPAGAFVGTPGEMALIHIMANSLVSADQCYGYKNVFNALILISWEEGSPHYGGAVSLPWLR